jgi:outer membrane protein OmpA-like peptidoglycan-associated protein
MKKVLLTASIIATMTTAANAQLLGGGGGALGGLPSGGSVGSSISTTARGASRIDTERAATRTVTRATTGQNVDANGATTDSTVSNQTAAAVDSPNAPLATAPIRGVGEASANFAADSATRRVTAGATGNLDGNRAAIDGASSLDTEGSAQLPNTGITVPSTAVVAIPTSSAFVGTGPVLGNVNVRRTAVIGAGIAPIQRSQVITYVDTQYHTIRQNLAGTGALVEKRGDQIVVSMPAEVTFAFDKSDIRPRFYRPLNALGASLQEFPATYVDVIGHTDSKGSDAYNMSLSQRRAVSVASYLNARAVSGSRISAEGRGEFEPIDTNATTQGRAANRRVEIILTPVTA